MSVRNACDFLSMLSKIDKSVLKAPKIKAKPKEEIKEEKIIEP